MCRECKRTYDNLFHQKRSKEALKRKTQLQKKRRQENAKRIYELLLDSCCAKCGEEGPEVLDFDHLVREEKTNTIDRILSSSWSTIQKEIDKCRILCSNCHRRHTAKQMGWYVGFLS